MITGEDVCKKAFESHRGYLCDYESFKSGWYARETFPYEEERSSTESKRIINEKLDVIEQYIRQLYEDFQIDEADFYMGHNDPMGNILCLQNHIRHEVAEIADHRAAEQFLLF